MVPVEIEYISEMPRTSRGKVDYRALEELQTKRVQEDSSEENRIKLYIDDTDGAFAGIWSGNLDFCQAPYLFQGSF